MRLFSKRTLAVAGAVAVMAAGGTVAFAFFAAPGAGTTTAQVGTAVAPLIQFSPSAYVCTGADASTLSPGCSETGTLSITNEGSGNQYIGAVNLASWTGTSGTCDSSDNPGWFTLGTWNVDSNFAPGQMVNTTSDPIQFVETNSNQTACAGQVVTFTFTSN